MARERTFASGGSGGQMRRMGSPATHGLLPYVALAEMAPPFGADGAQPTAASVADGNTDSSVGTLTTKAGEHHASSVVTNTARSTTVEFPTSMPFELPQAHPVARVPRSGRPVTWQLFAGFFAVGLGVIALLVLLHIRRTTRRQRAAAKEKGKVADAEDTCCLDCCVLSVGADADFRRALPGPDAEAEAEAGMLPAVAPCPPMDTLVDLELPGRLKLPEERLPEHLKLGITLDGLKQLLRPSTADATVDAPPPGTHDDSTSCERLVREGSPHVGPATVFVSCADQQMGLAALLDVLEAFIERTPALSRETTRFWLHAHSSKRQEIESPDDYAWLGATVRAVGRVLLLLEQLPPPREGKGARPGALGLGAVYYTQRCGGVLHMAASSRATQEAFEAALLNDFGGVQMALSRVDVRGSSEFLSVWRRSLETSDEPVSPVSAARLARGSPPSSPARPPHSPSQRSRRRTASIDLDPIEQGRALVLSELAAEPGGLPRVNQLVVSELRSCLAGEGTALLATRSARERGLSPFAVPLARLLRSTGHVPAARTLLEEAHGARRDALGWRHADTRLAFDNLVELLRAQGNLPATRRLHQQLLAACRIELGDTHPATLGAMTDLGTLLQELGNLTAALPVLEEALSGLRAVAGPKDAQTLDVMHRLAMLHFYSRRLPRAKALLMEATAGLSETCGARHPDTLDTVANHGHLFYFEGHAAAALPLLSEALAGRRVALGNLHPETIDSMGQLGELHKAIGNLRNARELVAEGLGCLKQLGFASPASREQEVRWARNLLDVLVLMGDEEAAAALRDEYGFAPPPPGAAPPLPCRVM
jgi:tetratricopeptide (TPR) repeat protein